MRIAGLLLGLLLLTACSNETSSKQKIESRTNDTTVTPLDVQQVRVRESRTAAARRNGDRQARVTTSTASRNDSTTASAELEQAGTDPMPLIRGRIVDKITGGPVPGVRLTLFDFNDEKQKWSVPVAETGAFSREVDPDSGYLLRADAEGFASYVSNVLTVTTGSAEEILINLDRGREIAGTVLGAQDRPVPDATVLAMVNTFNIPVQSFHYDSSAPDNNQKFVSLTRSDAQGRFTLEHVTDSIALDIVAEKRGFAYPGVYRLAKGDSSTSEVTLRLPLTGPVSGIVVNEDGEPLAETSVTLSNHGNLHSWSEALITTASGTFQVDSAPYGTTSTLIFNKPGYELLNKPVALSDELLSVTLIRESLTTLTVHCYDAQTMEKLPSVTVTAMELGGSQQNIILDEVAPGTYQVYVAKGGRVWVVGAADGYTRSFVEGTLTNADAQDLELLMHRSSTIRGRVLDGVSNKPIEGATFTGDRRPIPDVKSNAEGLFEFSSVTGGSYSAISPDGRKKDFTPRQSAGGVVDVGDVVIAGNSTLTVKVVRAGGRSPVRGAKVDVKPERSPNPISGMTDYEGNFVTEVPGDNKVDIALAEYDITKTVLPSGTGQWRITVPVGEGQLTGRLLMNGEPVSGSVSGKHKQLAMLATRSQKTGSDGRFDIKYLTPGSWQISAYSMGNTIGHASVDVEIPESNAPVKRDIELGTGARKITGRVVTEADDPVPGASIRKKTPRSTGGATADENGRFETTIDQAGECEFTASHDDFGRSDIVKVVVPESDEPLASIELVLKGGDASVECTIVSILDGLRINAGGHFWLEKNGVMYASAGQQPGRAGGAVIKGLPPGPYRMKVSASGFSRAERDINLQPGQKLEVTEVLSPAASVTIMVVDSAGQILQGAAVTLTPLDPESLQQMLTLNTGDSGTAQFPSVLYGNYRADVTANGAAASMTFSTNNEREMSLQMVLDPVQITE